MNLRVLAREYIWLWDTRHGVSPKEISMREGVSLARVRFGVSRARALEKSGWTESEIAPPHLVPLFPLGAFTPQSPCGHNRPIKPGSFFCCVVCHASGVDDHPALKRDPRTDPAPEPKPKPQPTRQIPAAENRKQRRARVFGAPSLLSAS
jgi:hypothetical protein